jgi:hypothetical protein
MPKRLLAVVALVLVAGGAYAKPSPDELAALIAQTDAIAKVVSDLRGLPIKKHIPRGVMAKPEIEKRILERLDEDYGPGGLAAEEKALKRLRLIPAELDYRKEIVSLLTEQVAGFYDPIVRELYIADWIDVSMQRMVMAHEIDHALQDQRFDLNRFTKIGRDNLDQLLAREALVEGDGVALMVEYMMRELGQKNDPWADDAVVNAMSAATGMTGAPEFDKAPLYLKETLLFPYRDGLRLVASARKLHPWADVDAMYARPPVSTEQVLHPEKYRADERPVPVRQAPLPALAGWTPIYVNVLGELLFDVLLRQNGLAEAAAARAAAGWGGDRLVVLEHGDARVAVDLSVWDAEADALEAMAGLSGVLPSLGGAVSYDDRGVLYAVVTAANGEVSFVERKGAKLLLVVGAPAGLAGKIRAEAWARWHVGR